MFLASRVFLLMFPHQSPALVVYRKKVSFLLLPPISLFFLRYLQIDRCWKEADINQSGRVLGLAKILNINWTPRAHATKGIFMERYYF